MTQLQSAQIYEKAPAEQQRKLDALRSLKLSEVMRAKRPLEVHHERDEPQSAGAWADPVSAVLFEHSTPQGKRCVGEILTSRATLEELAEVLQRKSLTGT
jgi:hypothetical protein